MARDLPLTIARLTSEPFRGDNEEIHLENYP